MKRFFALWIVMLIGISGCCGDIVYKYVFVRPEIPKMQELSRPKILPIEFQAKDLDGKVLYCTSDSGMKTIHSNQIDLQKTIKSYEDLITVYKAFYDAYELERIDAINNTAPVH